MAENNDESQTGHHPVSRAPCEPGDSYVYLQGEAGSPLPQESKWVPQLGGGNQSIHWSRTYQSPTAGATAETSGTAAAIE